MSRILFPTDYYVDRSVSYGEEGGRPPICLVFRDKDTDARVGTYVATVGEDGEIRRIAYGPMFDPHA